MKTLVTAAVLALVLTLAACGGGDDGGDSKTITVLAALRNRWLTTP